MKNEYLESDFSPNGINLPHEWSAVKKNTNWDGHSSSTVDSPLVRIQCLDGYMEYDADAETWEEVKA